MNCKFFANFNHRIPYESVTHISVENFSNISLIYYEDGNNVICSPDGSNVLSSPDEYIINPSPEENINALQPSALDYFKYVSI